MFKMLLNKIRSWFQTYDPNESRLYEHAKRELDYIGMTEHGDEMNVEMRNHILTMVSTFAKEGHSGFSASYAIGLLEKILRFEPLSPLRGTDDEWILISERTEDGKLYQNNRCSRVFKNDHESYDIEGKVFVDEIGSYTNINSHVSITFPYTPKTEYVQVNNSEG